jgi:hypothetical protein
MADSLSKPTALSFLIVAAILLLPAALPAQQSDPRAVAVIRAAIASQMEADRTDHSNWTYQDRNIVPGTDGLYSCVQTPQGELRRLTVLDGHPLDASATQAETQHISAYMHDTAAQARNLKNAEHDDAQATELLKMLPDAFLWNIASETKDLITLNYRPDPAFDGPDMQSRVMSTMAGEMIIAHHGNVYRIRTFRGALVSEFKIGFGFLGHLDKGGTFDVERRDVGNGLWEITETHVHIGGRALFFKSIGSQQDETKYEWKPSPARTLAEAGKMLGVPN